MKPASIFIWLPRASLSESNQIPMLITLPLIVPRPWSKPRHPHLATQKLIICFCYEELRFIVKTDDVHRELLDLLELRRRCFPSGCSHILRL